MDSMNITLASYGFVINFFPIYKSIQSRSNSRGFLSVSMALSGCFVIYITFSLLALKAYGSDIQPNIFENVKMDKEWISIGLRVLFMCIFLCNIPFTFFAGKECFIMLIVEFTERRVSRNLDMDIALRHPFISNPINERLLHVGNLS